MKRAFLLVFALVVFLRPFSVFSEPPAPDGETGEKGVNFETHVRPILKANCFECHGEGKKLKGRLDLRRKQLRVTGGKSGTALSPGKPADSLLLQRVKKQEMPPGKKKLTKDEIAIIERWIQGGALTLRAEPESLPLGFSISEDEA